MPSFFRTAYRWGDPVEWGQEGITWGPPVYSNLITSEHADKPKYMAMIQLTTQPFADVQNLLGSLPSLFDVDQAVNKQLDYVGERVGQSRDLEIPLTGVYFSFDTAGQGFDQGVWKGPYDPSTELDQLDDPSYRALIKARIGMNYWDGTIPGAYAFMDALFTGNTFFIQDHGDKSITIGLIDGSPLNAVTFALLTNGYINLKPLGIRLRGYVTPSVPGSPIFGFDANSSAVAGFDVGTWGNLTKGD